MNLAIIQKYLPFTLLLLAVFLVPSFALAGFQMFLWDIVIGLFGTIMGIAGKLLNLGVNDLVIGFGNQYSGDLGKQVDTVWVNVRDIFNITFIFGLVYIGFKMILNSDDSGTKRWLIHLIMAALLVNFSLYITKFVIDVSNVLASEITMSGFDQRDKRTGEVDISGTFMNSMGITSIFKGEDNQKVTEAAVENGGLPYIFGTMITLIVATFVFAAGGFLLIIRFAVLLIYMILSPLMFIGWVFPQLQKYTSQYWTGFLGRAFFAPIYLLLLYLSAKILQTYTEMSQIKNNPIDHTKTWTGDGIEVANNVAATLLPFIIGCIFLIASIVIANKMGAQGASTAMSVGNKMRRGGQRLVARNTLGYGARGVNMMSEGAQKRYRRLDAKLSKTGSGKALRTLATIGTLGALSDKNIESTLKAGTRVRVAGSETNAEAKTRDRERTNRQNQNIGDEERIATFDNSIKKLTDTSTSAEELTENLDSLSKTVRDMSDEQRENLGVEQLKKPLVSTNLTDTHIDKLQKSGKFSSQQIKEIKDSRKTGFETIAKQGSVVEQENSNAQSAKFISSQRQKLMSRDVKSAGELPVSVFTQPEMARYMSPQALEQRIKNGGVGEDERKKIEANIQAEILEAGNDSTTTKKWTKWTNNSTVGSNFDFKTEKPKSKPMSKGATIDGTINYDNIQVFDLTQNNTNPGGGTKTNDITPTYSTTQEAILKDDTSNKE